MTPYYADDFVTLYHGDCAEVLPTLDPCAATVAVTDPPYNVGYRYSQHDDAMDEADYLAWLRARLDAVAELLPSNGQIAWFWQGSRVANGQVLDVMPSGYLVHHLGAWFKREFAGDLWKGGHPAYSWEPIVWAARVGSAAYAGPKGGHAGRDMLIGNSSRHDRVGFHPCPKPLSVVASVVAWLAAEGSVVLDPFAGSGTTLLAAKAAGVRSIGVEVDEAYCEGIANRLSQGVLGLVG